jgi:hypothetical protein
MRWNDASSARIFRSEPDELLETLHHADDEAGLLVLVVAPGRPHLLARPHQILPLHEGAEVAEQRLPHVHVQGRAPAALPVIRLAVGHARARLDGGAGQERAPERQAVLVAILVLGAVRLRLGAEAEAEFGLRRRHVQLGPPQAQRALGEVAVVLQGQLDGLRQVERQRRRLGRARGRARPHRQHHHRQIGNPAHGWSIVETRPRDNPAREAVPATFGGAPPASIFAR